MIWWTIKNSESNLPQVSLLRTAVACCISIGVSKITSFFSFLLMPPVFFWIPVVAVISISISKTWKLGASLQNLYSTITSNGNKFSITLPDCIKCSLKIDFLLLKVLINRKNKKFFHICCWYFLIIECSGTWIKYWCWEIWFKNIGNFNYFTETGCLILKHLRCTFFLVTKETSSLCEETNISAGVNYWASYGHESVNENTAAILQD